MRILITILIGIIGGFLLGIALSNMIGVLGWILFHKPLGIKFLPYFTAILCAIVAPIWDNRKKSTGK